jgi:class 3 adenylate cyclase
MRGEPVRGGFPPPRFESLPGLEQARAILRGLVPRSPLSHLLGLRLTQVGPGTATVTMPATPWLQGWNGQLVYATLADAAASMTLLSGAPPGADVAITSGCNNPFRPCTTDSETLIARGRTVNTGPTFAHAEVMLEDALGRLIGQTIVAAIVRERPPAVPPALSEPVPQPNYPSPDPYRRPLRAGTGVVPPDQSAGEDGLAIARRVFFGDLPRPPLLEIFGARPLAVESGHVTFEASASEWLCHTSRRVAPGVMADLMTAAAFTALMTTAPPASHAGMSMNSLAFLRSVEADGSTLSVAGRVSHAEGGVLLADAAVTDSSGRLVAVAQSTGLHVASRRRTVARSHRLVVTVLFTDLVRSTTSAELLGDERWTDLLARHHAAVRRELEVHRGREVKTTGDGFLATFENPADAVECARRVREQVRNLALEVRMGIHSGQCEVSDGDIAGIAVHVAARVLATADPGEILVSSTVRDLLLGSDLKFEDRGRHGLKDIEGEWHLYAVSP